MSVVVGLVLLLLAEEDSAAVVDADTVVVVVPDGGEVAEQPDPPEAVTVTVTVWAAEEMLWLLLMWYGEAITMARGKQPNVTRERIVMVPILYHHLMSILRSQTWAGTKLTLWL